jgi:hypothetical protein
VRWSARLAFVVGVTASITANVVAAHASLGARIVAGWPALALVLVVEILSRGGKAARYQTPVIPEPAVDPEASQVEIVRKPGKRTAPSRQTRRPVEQTRQLIRELRADDPAMSVDDLAQQLKISPRRVRQVETAGSNGHAH